MKVEKGGKLPDKHEADVALPEYDGKFSSACDVSAAGSRENKLRHRLALKYEQPPACDTPDTHQSDLKERLEVQNLTRIYIIHYIYSTF